MKKLILLLAALLFAGSVQAQTILNSTTLNGAVTQNQTTVTLTSVTLNIVNGAAAFSPAIAVGQELVVADGGGLEAMIITAINGTVLTVQRGQAGTVQAAHATGGVVFVGPTSNFYNGPPGSTSGTDPGAACTRAQLRVLPYIEIGAGTAGIIWTCGSQGTPGTASTWSAVVPYAGQGATPSTGWQR